MKYVVVKAKLVDFENTINNFLKSSNCKLVGGLFTIKEDIYDKNTGDYCDSVCQAILTDVEGKGVEKYVLAYDESEVNNLMECDFIPVNTPVIVDDSCYKIQAMVRYQL